MFKQPDSAAARALLAEAVACRAALVTNLRVNVTANLLKVRDRVT